MMAKAAGLPLVAITPMASSVSENSSLANLATASSNGPASTGSTVAKISNTANGRARKLLKKLVSTGRPRQKQWGRRRISPPSPACSDLKGGSGALTAALVGLGVVVAALLADPVADQVLGALELLRPCIAGHQARGLPHHVELAVALDLADEHRLGDVVVRQHLRRATGQVRRLGARESIDHLVRIGRLHFLDRLHPHVEADVVRFHRIV